MGDILKQTHPFEVVSDTLLFQIAALGRQVSHKPGSVLYDAGDRADDIFVILSGKVRYQIDPNAKATRPARTLHSGDVFGWTALLAHRPSRLSKAVCIEPTEIVRLSGEKLLRVLAVDSEARAEVTRRFASLIASDYPPAGPTPPVDSSDRKTGASLSRRINPTMYRLSQWLKSPRPYLMFLGFALFLGSWYLAVEVWKLPRFAEMPGLTVVIKEWFSKDPTYGLSLYTGEYYQHIGMSVWRIAQAFFWATLLGVPTGLLLGWSRKFKDYAFPVFEILRPIPVLAWVPLAIVMFVSTESAVIFLAFLASFFATALNAMLGVESIDESYLRAVYCLGANRWQAFRHVIVPGALPFVFTGLQISVGVAWFSLVAAEMVSGQYGLGYVINTSYSMVRYPTIIIGMITLGAVGYLTSALVRLIGDYLMQWRARDSALKGDS
jgi:ABC-type nitrate/sulfonate/bicarbonate transport system permease component